VVFGATVECTASYLNSHCWKFFAWHALAVELQGVRACDLRLMCATSCLLLVHCYSRYQTVMLSHVPQYMTLPPIHNAPSAPVCLLSPMCHAGGHC
jgi:hypothetical protein